VRRLQALRGVTPLAPDYAEPVSGWRAWLVSEVDGRPLLGGVVFHAAWEPGVPHVAQCLHFRPQRLRPWRRRSPDHEAPGEGCRCGIYAAAELADARDYAVPGRLPEPVRWPTLHRVVGRAALWGRVVEHERGWRASHGYPELLLVPADDASWLVPALEAYGVPIEVVRRPL